jgi:hypothetical protein
MKKLTKLIPVLLIAGLLVFVSNGATTKTSDTTSDSQTVSTMADPGGW